MKSYIFFLCFVFNISCNTGDNKKTYFGEAQGTTYQISTYTSLKKNLKQDIDSILKGIDQSLSLYINGSTISKVNDTNTIVQIDSYFEEVFNTSKDIYEATNGAFEPTVLPLVKSWGFGPNKTPNSDNKKIDSLLKYVNYDSIIIVLDTNDIPKANNKQSDTINFKPKRIIKKKSPYIQLDFNAIAQGYTVDIISNHFKKLGIQNFLIELGGEVIAYGTKPNNAPWKVGIDKPLENAQSRELQIAIDLKNKALATSGNYRQYYMIDGIKYAHTIDPKTGFPVTHTLLSATVIANTCAEADAYATAFMVMGLDASIKFLSSESGESLDAYFIFTNQEGNWETYETEGVSSLIKEIN